MSKEIIFCKSGGCSAKLGAGALERVLSKLDKKKDENLLVGFDSHDDGSVYKLNDEQAIINTLDFFPPMIEDPYRFGQVAACNAMSDIYAMGGNVLTALNIVCFPETLDMNLLGKILQGGNDKVIEAGGVLCGGHSIVDEDIKYGMSVTGVVHPDKIYRNNTCKNGDALILTKKLGVGIVMAAHKMNAVKEEVFEEAINSMTTLNKYAKEVLDQYTVHACSDVTGFGLLVHLDEMLDGKHSAILNHSLIPMFDGVKELANDFYITAAAQKNRNHMDNKVEFIVSDFGLEEVLFDPQTSGGLLVSVPLEESYEIVKEMNRKGIPAQVIGNITPKLEKSVTVR